MAEQNPSYAPHHVEAFIDNMRRDDKTVFGWQCLTAGCGSEAVGFRTLLEAEAKGDLHVTQAEKAERDLRDY